ncbi:hypothetical protein PoB_005977400 [Plakobranchus ocellatus]|uniref:Uncharacterized protein n=1 Tax=Plakobranchus ocellatus TaxID=259542 RepID=A0AAV4CNF1_9GAST|nr:hypothetical protein PoB_005977400 [Plakobranchus ocellatus]
MAECHPSSEKEEFKQITDLDNGFHEICHLNFNQLSVHALKKRRQTIHGNEIKKDIKVLSGPDKKADKKLKVTRSTSSGSVAADISSCSAGSSSLALRNQSPTLSGIVKHTLRRRVSTCVMKHKLKKFQDYSLPYQHDSFALLRETCNIRNNFTSPPRVFRSPDINKPKAPPKPPRQKTPKRKSGRLNSPVWKRRIEQRTLKSKVQHSKDIMICPRNLSIHTFTLRLRNQGIAWDSLATYFSSQKVSSRYVQICSFLNWTANV